MFRAWEAAGAYSDGSGHEFADAPHDSTFGGCSPIATHMRRSRTNDGRFILSAATVARPVAVEGMITVASSFHAK